MSLLPSSSQSTLEAPGAGQGSLSPILGAVSFAQISRPLPDYSPNSSCPVQQRRPNIPDDHVDSAGEAQIRRVSGFYKVPVDQRRVNPDAYEPYLFSFGPYGHLQAAAASTTALTINDGEHFKQMAAETLLGESGLQEVAQRIQGHDSAIRALYLQMQLSPPMSAGDLATHLALDAVAILAGVMKLQHPLLTQPMARSLVSDALLLENQIPLFVVQYALMESAKLQNRMMIGSDLQNVLRWYRDSVNPFTRRRSTRRTAGRQEVEGEVSTYMNKPLLAYIYDSLTHHTIQSAGADARPAAAAAAFEEPEPAALPRASYLARCGVRFRPCGGGFSGIGFNERTAVLGLPTIVVGDNTIRFLHNLLAYEATASAASQCAVISYCYFMDRLIDSEEDVRVLAEAGVIRNCLGSDGELAFSWNKLCVFVEYQSTPNDRCVTAQVARLAKKRWRRWRAALKEQYWDKQPWLLVSVLAATILLVLTFLQTIYTIKGSSSY